MRISDWSSDVCSSDLRRPGVRRPSHRAGVSVGWARGASFEDAPAPPPEPCLHLSMHTALRSAGHPATMMGNVAFVAQNDSPAPRSEEHTSELQSLMRNSYAVFCLKKKQINKKKKYKQRKEDKT